MFKLTSLSTCVTFRGGLLPGIFFSQKFSHDELCRFANDSSFDRALAN